MSDSLLVVGRTTHARWRAIVDARSRSVGLIGILLMAAGIWAAAPAGATFSGATNGNVAFASICASTIGQATYSLNPNGSPPPTYSCPGGSSPNYTQSTVGGIDSMPSFDAQGTTLYFSSDRPGSGNNPGANGNFAIYQVTYPSTVSGSPGSQTDGATQITFPAAAGGTSNDYAPTVSTDGSELTFIRCNSGTTSCALYVQNPIVGGTPTLISTSVALLQPDSVSGAASRPEINPAAPGQALYVGTDNHVHLVSLASPPTFTERDLSNESGIAAGQIDEYPDWNPAGTRIIFDRSHSGVRPRPDRRTGNCLQALGFERPWGGDRTDLRPDRHSHVFAHVLQPCRERLCMDQARRWSQHHSGHGSRRRLSRHTRQPDPKPDQQQPARVAASAARGGDARGAHGGPSSRVGWRPSRWRGPSSSGSAGAGSSP